MTAAAHSHEFNPPPARAGREAGLTPGRGDQAVPSRWGAGPDEPRPQAARQLLDPSGKAAGPRRYVLVTGSRGWRWPELIAADLDAQRRLTPPGGILVVVHGGCKPTDEGLGADYMAHLWAAAAQAETASLRAMLALAPVEELVFEADWYAECRATCEPGHRKTRKGETRTYCPAAGPYRNADMVAAAAELGLSAALGYLLNDSPGTRDCIDQLDRRRISNRVTKIYTRPRAAA